MSGLFGKAMRFAKSKQGKEALGKVQAYAKSEKGKERIEEIKEKAEHLVGRDEAAKKPAAKAAAKPQPAPGDRIDTSEHPKPDPHAPKPPAS